MRCSYAADGGPLPGEYIYYIDDAHHHCKSSCPVIVKYAEDINKLTHVHLQYTFVYHQLNYVQLRYAVTFKQKKSVTMK